MSQYLKIKEFVILTKYLQMKITYFSGNTKNN